MKKDQSIRKEVLEKDLHRSIIDEYFLNGFNGSKAVTTIKEYHGLIHTPSTNRVFFTNIMKAEANKLYIDKKRLRLKALTDITNEQVLKELINWAYCDITDFISLGKDEVKLLPPSVRRCIQSYKETKKTYTQRDGTSEVVETIEIKLIDKTKALESISKHIGFYLIDNRQKRPTINIDKLNIEELKVLNQVMIQQQGAE